MTLHVSWPNVPVTSQVLHEKYDEHVWQEALTQLASWHTSCSIWFLDLCYMVLTAYYIDSLHSFFYKTFYNLSLRTAASYMYNIGLHFSRTTLYKYIVNQA